MTATLWHIAEPWEGQLIVFNVDNTSLLNLDVASASTNTNGQCRVIISGKGATGTTKLRATFVDPITQVIYQGVIDVTVVTETATPQNTQPDKSAFQNGNAIPYVDNATTFSTETSQARTTWTNLSAPACVGFAASSGEVYLRWSQPVNSTATWLAQESGTSNTSRRIEYNLFKLDGDPWGRGTSYAPKAWRHDIQHIANHELGHALLLAHNDAFAKSLMYSTLRVYDVWKTVDPLETELTPVRTAYTCP